jgi:hypothetical protein
MPGKRLKTPEIVSLRKDQIEFSPLNPNREDSSTFASLKKSIEEHGMLDLPVVQVAGDGTFRCVGGEHRLKAMFEEYEEVPVIVAPRTYTAEDEFNVIGNLNLIRGKITLANLRKVVQDHDLDVGKIDLHGVPPWMLGKEKTESFKTQEKRAADELKAKQLALQIAKPLAVTILEDRDEDGLLVCEAEGKAVVLAGFGVNTQWLRANRDEVKSAILTAIRGMQGFDPSSYGGDKADALDEE